MEALKKGLLFASFLVVTACGDGAESTDLSAPQQFFENSTRRDATAAETIQVAKLGGCAAFFVEGTNEKTFMVSARHCVNRSISTWCNSGTVRTEDGRVGRCAEVVAADTRHDIALFRVEMDEPPARETMLQLSSRVPAVGTRMKMIGYPADSDPQNPRRGRLTVTENCWILATGRQSPHRGSLGLYDISALHNCSTYGGNSGGPMIDASSRLVYGLPFTYQPNDYRRRSATSLNTAAHMAQMSDFVATFRTQLQAAGVVVVD